MDLTEIIVAAITGGLAVVGQYLLTRKQNVEKEIKDDLREKEQMSRLDKIEHRLADIDGSVVALNNRVTKLEGSVISLEGAVNRQQVDLSDNNLRTMRLDLLHAIESDPDNQMVILEMARKYFGEMHGNCYMSKVFQDWADEHNVNVISVMNGGAWTS